jgi:hypothetical protein
MERLRIVASGAESFDALERQVFVHNCALTDAVVLRIDTCSVLPGKDLFKA